MAEDNLAIKSDNNGVRDEDVPVIEDPDNDIARHSRSGGSSGDEGGERDEAEQPPLHKKLLAIAEAEQPTNAATLAEFNTLLIENRSQINARDSNGKTALQIAIEHDLDLEARHLIQNKADIGIGDHGGQQPLSLACSKGNAELVKLLLSKDAAIDAADNAGETALAAACRNGHTQIVNLLLEKNANTNTSDEDKWTPIHWASWKNHVEILKRLLDEEREINPIETNENWTPLNAAAYRGHEKVVSLLLEKDADLCIADSSGWTPLMTATRMEHPEVVRTILRHNKRLKRDVLDTPDDGANTPLHVASYEGYYDIASQLIDAGANCKATDSEDRTPLHLASSQNHYKIVDLLLRKAPKLGIDINANAKATSDRTSLHLASLHGNELISKALLQEKAYINAIDALGNTPLHLACGANTEDRCLSDPDPVSPGPSGEEDPDWKKRNAEASSGRHLPTIELLLLNKADPNLKAANGDTALHRAAAIGDKGRINVLLSHIGKEDFYWKDWKDSPVYSAIGGDDPQTAVETLLAKPEMMEAPFWENCERSQVIKDVFEDAKLRDILPSVIDILPSVIDGVSRNRQKLPEESGNWNVFQWVAYERLPKELSELIDMTGLEEEIYEMVHKALSVTCHSITAEELVSDTSCERLIHVMIILITNSARTDENKKVLHKASDFVGKNSKHPGEGGEKSGKKSTQEQEQPFRIERSKDGTNALFTGIEVNTANAKDKLDNSVLLLSAYLEYIARNSESRGMKNLQTHTTKAGKRHANLSILQDILKDPPFGTTSRTYRDKESYRLPVSRPNHHDAIEHAEATVVGFFKGEREVGSIRRNRTIQNIAYGEGPIEVVGNAVRYFQIPYLKGMHFNSKLYAKKNLKLTWVHLPSTNMVWMNDLLTTIMHNEGYQAREWSELKSFFRDSWVVVPDKESHSRMMRPQSVIRPMETDKKVPRTGEENKSDSEKVEAAVAGSRDDEQEYYVAWDSKSRQLPEKKHEFVDASALYMPYLAYSSHCEGTNEIKDTRLKNAHEAYEGLLKSYEGKDEQQHGSPTLDEWYYQFAQEDKEATNDQKDRNKSQVVSKYLKEKNDGSQWTVVRVNQLWIWTIADNWVITSTSSPLDNSPDVLVDEILNLLSKQAEYGGSRAQPVCAAELVPIIVDHCIGSYDRRPSEAGRISIGQTFSHYINRIGRNETNLFNDFRTGSSGELHRKKHKRSPSARDSLEITEERLAEGTPAGTIANTTETKPTIAQPHNHDIGTAIREAKDLCFYIKDVRDELNILKSVAGYQQIVQSGLAGKAVDVSRLSSTYVLNNLKELDSTAERIQAAINTTLSLQQSQVANDQATEATRQGKNVMTFTFATVLFLPLSFLSSLFALDVASFQQAPAWAFYVIFLVSIGISITLGFGVFYWEDIKHIKHKCLHRIGNAAQGIPKPPPTPPKSPEKGIGGREEKGKSDRTISIVSKTKASKSKLSGLFRRNGRKADDHDIEGRAAVSRT